MRDRYLNQRKTDRNLLLEQYAKEHPEASYSDIGKMFSITKQRVQQILKAAEEKEKAATVKRVAA